MVQFKDISGWDEAMERSALAKERKELYGTPQAVIDNPLDLTGRVARS